MYLDKNGLNVIIKVSRNAKGIEGTSNLMKADREQPAGERHMQNLRECILELRTENFSRLRRIGTRYRAQ